MEFTMENYYDNLEKHGYTKADLPALMKKSSSCYHEIMNEFDGWFGIFTNKGNQICIQTEDFKQKTLQILKKGKKYCALILRYEYFLPDDGNYYNVTYEKIDLKNLNECKHILKLWHDESYGKKCKAVEYKNKQFNFID